MCVMNDIGRVHLVGDVIDRVPELGTRAAYPGQPTRDQLIEHKHIFCGAAATWRHADSTETDNV
jgi:phosphoketolase